MRGEEKREKPRRQIRRPNKELSDQHHLAALHEFSCAKMRNEDAAGHELTIFIVTVPDDSMMASIHLPLRAGGIRSNILTSESQRLN